MWWQAYEVAYGRLGPERQDILTAMTARNAHMPHVENLSPLEEYLPQWGPAEEQQEYQPPAQPGLW